MSEPARDLARREGDALSQIVGTGDTRAALAVLERPVHAARFWQYVDQRHPDECWPWLGHKSPRGYGAFRFGPSHWQAHRVAYALAVGPIPAGLVVDHLCRRRDCVNPLHLEAVTSRENTMRGETVARRNALATACIRGHPFTPENTRRWGPRGRRQCITCLRDRGRAHV